MIKENFIKYFENAIIENWDNTALIDYTNGKLSYKEVGLLIKQIHKLFEEHGIKKGDKIALIGKNSANWGSVFIATISYGAVIVPLLQDFTPLDVYKLTNHSDAKLLFTSDFVYNKLDNSKFDEIDTIYKLGDFSIFDDKSNKNITLSEIDNTITKENYSLPKIDNSELAEILYTSGTSGLPKGVMLDHNTLAANLRFARANMPLVSKDKIVSFLPMAHSYGCAFEFLYPFSLGCEITFLGKLPSPNVVIKAFNEIKPKLILSVPLVLEKVYKNKIVPTISKPSTKILLHIPIIKNIIHKKIREGLNQSFGGVFIEAVIGGAKLNKEVEIFLRKIGFRFSIGYGMTECGPLITYDGWQTTKKFSAGKVVDSLEIKIDSKDPENSAGEILLRGENIMLGYYKNEEETKKAFTEDNWLRTGDLATIDKDGYLFIKGRNKSMIVGPSGQNIYPEEIESKLLNFPLVNECLVVVRDEVITALIYPDKERIERQNIKQEAVDKIFENYKSLANKHLPNYSAIKKLIIRDKEFEKTPKKSIKRYLYK